MIRRFLVALTLLAVAFPAFSQICDTSLWSPNGQVNSLLLRDSLLFVAGDYDQVSPVTGRFIRLDSTTAQLAPQFPFISGKVNCMAKDSVGRIYVGGNFSQVGHVALKNLFRMDTLGNVDTTFRPDPNGEIFTLSCDSHRLWVGGDFLTINGFARMRGAAIHVTQLYMYIGPLGDTTISVMAGTDTLTYFNPLAQGPIYSLCVDSMENFVIAGGDFAGIAGFPITYVAKLFAETGQSAPLGNTFWQCTPNLNGAVRALRTRGDLIYMAGDFTALGADQRYGLALIHFGNGTLLTTDSLNQPAYNAGINGPVHDIELLDGKLYIAGRFGIVDGTFRSNIARLDMMLNVDTGWIVDADKEVFDIQAWGNNTLCFGGDFRTVNGDTAYHIALVERDTVAVHNWNAVVDGTVYALMPALNGKLYAGGFFNGANGVLRKNLCAININTKRPNSWKPEIALPVNTLYASPAELFFSGDFNIVNGQPRNRIASFDLATYALTAFNPGVNGLVRTMASDQSKLYIGGNFTNAGGQTRNNIACIDLSNSQATVWNPGCAGTANKIILENQWLYIGGFFSQVGGQPRQNLARVFAATGAIDWNWTCDTDNGVYDMDLFNGNLYFGGWFDHAAGQAREHLGEADTISGALQAFNPGISDYVRCFTRWNDDLFMSGVFTVVSTSYNYSRLANFDIGDNQFDAWSPVPDVMPVTMQASQNWLYIGGEFEQAGYYFHPNLAMVNVNFVTGIPSVYTDPTQLNLWPNPANEFIYVSLPQTGSGNSQYTIQVLDVNGKIVREESSTGSNQSPLTIDISHLAPGMYLLLANEKGVPVSSKKFVKQ